jgi:hypothetical protein
METAVLFLIFNRPGTTAKVFEQIKKVQPSKLYVAADGPRKDRPSDPPLCKETRDIINKVDWHCQVYTLFRDENLGCKGAVSSAIAWFFENEEQGIILEDDCLPHPTFFTFCEVMLKRYANDYRVAHIGGVNFQKGIKRGDGDYYYSNLTHVWGWAGWRRVWNYYDVNMARWPQFKKDKYLDSLFQSTRIVENVRAAFENTFSGKIDTWDYQYFFSNLAENGLCIIPNVNLITNLGYSPDATHPAAKNDEYANLQVGSLQSFNAPTIFRAHYEADVFTLRKEARSLITKIKSKLKISW